MSEGGGEGKIGVISSAPPPPPIRHCLRGGQKKTRQKKNPVGEKNVIWLGTKAQAPSDDKLILRRLHREKEIRTADPTRPTRLNAWHLKKIELNKEKIK